MVLQLSRRGPGLAASPSSAPASPLPSITDEGLLAGRRFYAAAPKAAGRL